MARSGRRGPRAAFPGARVRSSLEAGLRASGLDHFDVVQFHVWSDEWVGRGEWLETVEDLKREGKIRLFGVSVNDHEPDNAVRLVRSGTVDTVQVIYNIFDRNTALSDGRPLTDDQLATLAGHRRQRDFYG